MSVSEGNLSVSRPSRIESISGIKAIALMLVFIWHTGVIKAPDLGARMCELFFVCSGVLEAINHHGKCEYTMEETVSIIKRKLARIYPLYIVSFLLAAPLGALGMKEWTIENNTTAAVLNLLMMQAWFSNLQFSFNGVSWFVADLMLCYLITPLLSYCVRRYETMAKLNGMQAYLVPFGLLFIVRLIFQIAQYKGVISISNHSFPLSRMLDYGMAFVAGCAILARGGGYRWAIIDEKILGNRFARRSCINCLLHHCCICIE